MKEATGGNGADVVVEHVGEATWKRSLQAAGNEAADRRLRRDERAEPAGAAPPDLVEAARDLRLDDGDAGGLRGRLRARRERAASRIVDSVFPLAEAAAAHERLEAGEQLGKIVLTIP